jgi:hypothetical protein
VPRSWSCLSCLWLTVHLSIIASVETRPDRKPSIGASVSRMRENCQSGSMSGNRKQGPSQTGLRRAKRTPNPTPTGRLQLLRLFSTLLPIPYVIPDDSAVPVNIRNGLISSANLGSRLRHRFLSRNEGPVQSTPGYSYSNGKIWNGFRIRFAISPWTTWGFWKYASRCTNLCCLFCGGCWNKPVR